jgi:hypothetical protein
LKGAERQLSRWSALEKKTKKRLTGSGGFDSLTPLRCESSEGKSWSLKTK